MHCTHIDPMCECERLGCVSENFYLVADWLEIEKKVSES